MRIVFMGSDEISCASLEALVHAGKDQVVAAITAPDRPQGRRRKIAPCMLKEKALELGVEVYSPEKIGSEESVETIKTMAPDLIVVVAYGQYIPSSVLNIPTHKAINLHPSLLPKYRGASPIQFAVLNGDKITGVTILYVSKEMDAGDILLQKQMPIDEEDTSETLGQKLAGQGAELLLEAIDLIRKGEECPIPQNHDEATMTMRIRKEDARIDWSLPAKQIQDQVRGYQPWPVAHTQLPDGTLLKLFDTVLDEDISGEPGTVVRLENDGPVIAAGDGALLLKHVQPAGKKPMSGRDFLNGYSLSVGECLI